MTEINRVTDNRSGKTYPEHIQLVAAAAILESVAAGALTESATVFLVSLFVTTAIGLGLVHFHFFQVLLMRAHQIGMTAFRK